MHGQFFAGAVKRLFGCAPFTPAAFAASSHGLPFQSTAFLGGFLSSPSHQTVLLSKLWQTFVKIVPFCVVCSALGLDFSFVPGATPKNPFSGFIAHSLPSAPTRIQAMSSPTVQILYPFSR